MAKITEPDHLPLRWFSSGVKATYATGSSTWAMTNTFGATLEADWTITANSADGFIMFHKGYVDLTGLQMNYMTCNPLSYVVQRWAPPENSLASVQATVAMQWITSTKEVPDNFNIGNITYAEGYGPSYDDLVGLHTEYFSSDSTTPMMVPTDATTLGTLQATAADRLHTMARISVVTTGAAGNGEYVLISPAVVSMAQEVVKEANLQYIMRLKRAYDS